MTTHNQTTEAWMAGYEAAKEQAAKALEGAAEHGFPYRREARLRAARILRGMRYYVAPATKANLHTAACQATYLAAPGPERREGREV